MERRKVRTLRHFRQRFDPGAEFIFRRPRPWLGKHYNIGDPVPDSLLEMPGKLRLFWDNGYIEIAQFEEIFEDAKSRPYVPDSAVVELATYGIRVPDGATVTKHGTWYEVTLADGAKGKVNGRDALREFFADPPPPPETRVVVESHGSGWYTVTRPDGTEDKIRGREKFQDLMAVVAGSFSRLEFDVALPADVTIAEMGDDEYRVTRPDGQVHDVMGKGSLSELLLAADIDVISEGSENGDPESE